MRHAAGATRRRVALSGAAIAAIEKTVQRMIAYGKRDITRQQQTREARFQAEQSHGSERFSHTAQAEQSSNTVATWLQHEQSNGDKWTVSTRF